MLFKKKRNIFFRIFLINTFFFFFFFFLFSTFPRLDIEIAKLFFENGEFLSEKYLFLKTLRTLLKNLMILISIISLIYIIFFFVNKRQKILKKKNRGLRFMLVVLGFVIGPIIGCGLIANLYFKDTWGRARPVNIEEFGGIKIYTPPFIKSDQCKKNCSWIGGEAAAAFSFMVGIIILKNPLKIMYLNIFFGIIVSLLIMSMGGHFFSDNLYSALFMIYLALIYRECVLFLLKKKFRFLKF